MIVILLHCGRLFTFILSFLELLDKLSKRCKFFLVYQIELVDEINEVLEASIQMSFCRKQHYMLEMGVIYVSVYAEQSLENYLDYI